MERKPYPIDVTDCQWRLIGPPIPPLQMVFLLITDEYPTPYSVLAFVPVPKGR